MKRIFGIALLGIVLGITTEPSEAAVYTLNFSGTVNRVDPGLPDFAIGNSMSASVSVDTAAQPGSTSADASYAVVSFQITVGPYSVISASPGAGGLSVSIGLPPSIPTGFTAINSLLQTLPPSGGPYVGSAAFISLGSYSTEPITNALILPTNVDPSQWDSANFSLDFDDPTGANGDAFVSGLLNSVTVTTAVPEMSTWTLLILGFAGLGFLGYRRRDAIMRPDHQ